MRISDWSSDVCSSDLHVRSATANTRRIAATGAAVRATALFAADRAGTAARFERIGVVGCLVSGLVANFAGTGDRRWPDRCRARRRLRCRARDRGRSEEHTSELQSLMRISYAVFCLKKKKNKQTRNRA